MSNLPQLRFPEFLDAGEWEEKQLFKLSECKLSNGVFNDPKKVGKGYKLINVLDMYIETAIDEKKLNLIDLSEDEFLKNKVETGDIFFTRSSLVKSGIACSNIYLGSAKDITFDCHLIRFRPNKKILSSIFANYLLKTFRVRSQLVARGKTATMTTIGQEDVSSIKLLFPHIKEQQKIAACLSSLDDLITAHTQKLDALKAHKKGLMQQLFPAEGETVPKLRFLEFRDAGEWEEKIFSDIGEFISGGTPDTSISEYWGGSIQWFTPTEIKQRYLSFSKRTITEKGLQNSSAKLLPKGALLLSTRATVGDVGIAQIECTTNQGFQSIVVNNSENNIFWYYWIIQHKNNLICLSSGSTFLEIGKTKIKKVKVLRPSKKEQQKIAACLSSLDDQITAQTQKIQTLKTHKKGLMQQLFPSADT